MLYVLIVHAHAHMPAVPILALTSDEILGWATVIMDQFGLRDIIKVMLFIGVAAFVYSRFANRGGD